MFVYLCLETLSHISYNYYRFTQPTVQTVRIGNDTNGESHGPSNDNKLWKYVFHIYKDVRSAEDLQKTPYVRVFFVSVQSIALHKAIVPCIVIA